MVKACEDDLCYFWNEKLGTHLVAGAVNKKHQENILSETASLLSLENKLDRLRTMEISESSSAAMFIKSVIKCPRMHPGTKYQHCKRADWACQVMLPCSKGRGGWQRRVKGRSRRFL